MIVYFRPAEVAEWVAERIPVVECAADFGAFSAIGVERAGRLVAGVVLHNYQPSFRSIEFTFAAEGRRWLAPGDLDAMLAYPFRQLGVHRLWAATAHPRARILALAAGFTIDAVIRDYFGPETPATLLSMTRPEWAARYEGHNNGW